MTLSRETLTVTLLLAACLALPAMPAYAQQAETVLRVCSDPDNMPLSNRNGEGFENRIAEELARDLGRHVEYTWFPQRMGFVRNTLKKKNDTTQQYECDLIIGVPAGYELTATTKPYMHSTYALVFPSRGEFNDLKTADDLLKLPPARLKALRIGVFAQSPGSDWLLRNGMIERAAMYAAQSGDPAENPGLIIGREMAAGKIDMAIVWGPIAGLLVREQAAHAPWRAVPFAPDPAIKFDYQIAMGVRFGEKQWQNTLDEWIAAHRDKVREILLGYRVPMVDESGKVTADFREQQARE
ncbi:MAG TPA: quinoprotein dehydrogenase-associated putative ABC transporter substrate-binding protein [Steroidobacteraceae bacterium]